MSESSKWRRRALLVGVGLTIVAWSKGVPLIGSLRRVELKFQDIPDLTPFRWLATDGAPTTGTAVFAGLGRRETLTTEQLSLDQTIKSDLCAALYGSPNYGPLPIAIFSDFNCPNCRIMETRIDELKASDPGSFRVVRHQLPILGEASKIASRAVLAAKRQGAYRQMHDRLIRTPIVADVSYVTSIAANAGLDVDQFVADLNSTAIQQSLRVSESIARVFGFYGTPALAVGRTVFLGAIPKSTLRTLIAEEVENPFIET